jgi:carboxypeptidase Q
MKTICTQLFLIISFSSFAQEDLSTVFKKISDKELSSGEAYTNLYSLCKDVGNRLSGSPQAAKAVEWGAKLMKSYRFDTVYLQECMVPHWVRGSKEQALAIMNKKEQKVNVLALGGSVATPENGISAELVEFKSLKDLKEADKKKVEGKIVFLNQSFDETKVFVFQAYGTAVGARWAGAVEASKLGALAVVVRSMTNSIDAKMLL